LRASRSFFAVGFSVLSPESSWPLMLKLRKVAKYET
jgi:hypothetical protein